MAVPVSFLLHRASKGDTHVLEVSGDQASSIASFPRNDGWYRGLTCALFDPADSNLPWRRGDLLVARSSLSRLGSQHSIVRLRRSLRRPGGYFSAVLYSDSARSPIRSLALDPAGRLYFSRDRSRRIQRLSADSQGDLRATAWAAVPTGVPWGGDFDFAPDGWLFISTGAGATPGRLFKISISADPEPDPRAVLQRIEWREAYEWSGGDIEGFSFYDGDRVLFASSADRFYGVDVDASLDPHPPSVGSGAVVAQPALPSLTPLPSLLAGSRVDEYSPAGPFLLHARDVAVGRNRLQQFLHDRPAIRDRITWIKRDGSSVGYDDWRQDPETRDDLERLLHRFYAYRVADRQPPLAYRYQANPDGSPRRGPRPFFQSGPIRRRDAAETYLAYLAHFLWMDIKRQVLWDIEGFGLDVAREFFTAGSMFQPYDGSIVNDGNAIAHGYDYMVNTEILGPVFPSNPYSAFQFITGDPAERDPTDAQNNPRDGESFLDPDAQGVLPEPHAFRLLRWIRDHLTHNDPNLQLKPLEHWGYEGHPPLEAFYRRTSHPDFGPSEAYRAWPGCQTASGFVSHLLRLMLIPARRRKTYLGDNLEAKHHSGFEILMRHRLNLHLDQLYADSRLPSMWPDTDFGPFASKDDYPARFALYSSPPANESKKDQRNVAYKNEMAVIALETFADLLFDGYWDDRVRDDGASVVIGTLRSAFEVPGGDADALFDQYRAAFDAKIDAFLAEHADEIQATDPDQRFAEGLDLYRTKFAEWEARH